MAAFTSISAGDWSNGPVTWGTAAGVYPGSVGAQADTASIGHIVNLDVTTFAGTCAAPAFTGSGELIVAANFTGLGKFTGNWTIGSGRAVRFKKAAGVFALTISDTTITVASGGTWEQDSSGTAGCTHILYQELNTVQPDLIGSSGSTITQKGRQKLGARTVTTAALTGGSSTTISVASDGGYEQGDTILVWRGRAAGTYEEATLGTNVSPGVWNLSTAITNTYISGCLVENLTRSCRVSWINSKAGARVSLAAGATVTLQDTAFIGCNNNVLAVVGQVVTRCVAWLKATSMIGLVSTGARQLFDSCFAYGSMATSGATAGFHLTSVDTELRDCGAMLVGANTGTRGFYAAAIGASGTLMTRCHAAAVNPLMFLAQSGGYVVTNSYFFGGTSGLSFAVGGGQGSRFVACVLGEDPAGNAVPNTRDINTPAPGVVLDDCKLASSSEMVVSAYCWSQYTRSLNHDNTAGFVREWQDYGVIESNAAEARSGTYCLACDPSNATRILRFMLTFPVASGKTPSLTFYAKGGGTLGNLTVSLGRHRAGLTAVTPSSGSLDANGRFTVTGSYVQKTINFTGTTDCAGAVEVFIDVLDSSSGILYVDDIAAAGNL